MGLGSTARTLQKVADMGEDVYKRLNEVREQVKATQDTVAETKARVASLETEVAEQRAILEAIAEQQGVDVDSVTAEAHIAEAERIANAEAEQDSEETTDSDETAVPEDDGASAQENGATTTDNA
ncbi:DUF5798 family protein [Haloprofundus salinisoli]|uniref:DUF5798 family protein n=1 Tax=Haloprofundus salinisoli TaxID=2876193 RepID=UPI001CCD27C9|nr:DUF5798 family protein [Haloprofundus salinisoli]